MLRKAKPKEWYNCVTLIGEGAKEGSLMVELNRGLMLKSALCLITGFTLGEGKISLASSDEAV
jgi:hypothetical protein